MRLGLLYLIAATLLVVIVSIGWWTRDVQRGWGAQDYTVAEGDTLASVAAALGVPADEIAAANGMKADKWVLVPGDVIWIAPRPATSIDIGLRQLVGVACLAAGTLLGYWLAIAGGVLPGSVRRSVLGLGFGLAIVSYGIGQMVTQRATFVDPQFGFAAFGTGFAWCTAMVLTARALGIRHEPTPSRTEPVAEADDQAVA